MWPFSKKKIVVHVFYAENIPVTQKTIKKAAWFIPNWWKQLDKKFYTKSILYPHPTMKSCAGFINLYKNGIIVPMWCDLNLLVGKLGTTEYAYQYSDGMSTAVVHPIQQSNGFIKDTEYQHLKLETPWALYCEENIEFISIEPTWNLTKYKTLKVLPGIYTLQNPIQTNINLIFSRTESNQIIELPFGTPMIHLIPLDNRKIELKFHIQNAKNKKSSLHYYRYKFMHLYDVLNKQPKEDKVCPIHGEGMK